MITANENFQEDIDAIGQIPIVATLLDVICQNTGMGFAAIARVTEERWITCSVRDDIAFGLKPGDELEIKTTICNEIREHQTLVVIDHVEKDPHFATHHTPAMYGFQSYISMPIMRKDGSFFGTLCAIDPNPNHLSSPAVVGMFQLFADLISFHLNALEEVKERKIFTDELEKKVKERTHQLDENNLQLEKMNKNLLSFVHISSHDLQEPLRKIQTFASIISDKEVQNLSEEGRHYFDRMKIAAERMQALLGDLLDHSRVSVADRKLEVAELDEILQEVREELKEELELSNALIKTEGNGSIKVIPFQFRQLLQNLISNSLKFAHSQREPRIIITTTTAEGRHLNMAKLDAATTYCHIRISDNGIGFEQQYNERIFELFQRLHDRSTYDGTGMGLSIVKKIVENHNGIITAKGEVDKGAVFDIYIPV